MAAELPADPAIGPLLVEIKALLEARHEQPLSPEIHAQLLLALVEVLTRQNRLIEALSRVAASSRGD